MQLAWLLIGVGNSARTMNATFQDILIDSSTSYYTKAWDVYDLWGNRMSNATAQAIMNGTSTTMSTLNGTQPAGELDGILQYDADELCARSGGTRH
jgi:hypothetical protein